MITTTLLLMMSESSYAQFSELNITSKGQKTSHLSTLRGKTQLVTQKQIKLLKLMGKYSDGTSAGYTVSQDSNARVKVADGAVTFGVDELNGEFTLKNLAGESKIISYKYQLPASEQGLSFKSCNDLNIDVKFSAVFPSGPVLSIFCAREGAKNYLGVSTLGTMEITTTSIPELDGKGETWRIFDLGATKAEASTMLDMTVVFAGKEYHAVVSSRKIENKIVVIQQPAPPPLKKENPREKQIVRVGAAYVMNKLAIANTYSDSSPGLYFSFTSKPLAWGLKVGADFKQFFAAKSDQAISSSDFKAYLSRDFELGSRNFLISPRAFFVNSKMSQSLTNFDLNLVSFGAGLSFNYYFSERDCLEFGYKNFGFGSDVVSSATSMYFLVNFFSFKKYNFNVGIEIQNVGGKSTAGNAIKADQNFITLGMGFD